MSGSLAGWRLSKRRFRGTRFSRRRGVVGCTLSLSACLISWFGLAPATLAVPLSDLFGGGTLAVGDTRYSDWELLSVDSTTDVVPDFSQVDVLPLNVLPSLPAIQFVSNGEWGTTGVDALDLSLRYRVDVVTGKNSLSAHSLAMTNVTFGASGGIAHVSAEVTDRGGNDLGPAVVIEDPASGVSRPNSTTPFDPRSQIFVTMSIFLTGTDSLDSVNLGTVTHGFAQIGPNGIPGDYNENGAVDAADYTVWRDNLGATVSLANDDSLGVGLDDYARWKMQFGKVNGNAAAHGGLAVPEPAAWLAFSAGAMTLLARRGRAAAGHANS